MSDQIKTFDRLVSATKRIETSKKRARAALVGAEEPSYLKMTIRAAEEGLIEPILIGPKNKIEENAKANDLDLSSLQIIDRDSKVDMIIETVKLVVDDKVDFIIRGNITTGLMLARMFERPNGLRVRKNILSHLAIFEHELYPRLLIMSDGGVTVAPNIDQKLGIILNSVRVANMLGVEMPRVAMMAAVEVIYTAMPVTMDGAVISKMQDKGQINNCYIDGPLSMDVALVPEVAEQKGVKSEVAGRADIIIMPNIETGNATYKAMSIFAKAKTASVIVGGKVPIALSSRCDTTDNIFNSLVLASFIALNDK